MSGKRRIALMLGAGIAAGTCATLAVAGTETDTVEIPYPEVRSATADCPPGKRVVLGGLRTEFDAGGSGPQIYIDKLVRRSKGKLRATGYNAQFATTGELTAIATCKREPKSRAKTKTVPTDDGPAKAVARCPKGTRIAFGGFDGEATAFKSFALPSAAYAQGDRKWVAWSTQSPDGDLTAIAYCGKVKATTERAATETIGVSGEGTATAECRSRERLAYGGFDGTAQDGNALRVTELRRTGPREWTVGASNFGSQSELTAYAYCVKKG